MIKVTRYRVKFTYGGMNGLSVVTPSSWSLPTIMEGFWVNKDFELCVTAEAKWFIMPHMFRSIEKLS